jgi:RNA polymerase sigma-70 factor (ECF subfamily)
MPADAMQQTQVGKLLMQHRTSLYAYIFANVRNHHDAEDILQSVSIAVMESFQQLTSEAGFLPWSLEIARRRVLRHYRDAGREQSLDPDLLLRLAEAAARVEQKQPGRSHEAALRACLEELPDSSRQMIQRRYDGSVADMAELAMQLGRSVQAVYAQIKRIKAALRECVERRLASEG